LSALFGQIDLTRSLAALVGATVTEGDCSDARDELDTLLGTDRVGRPYLVHEANNLALRQGTWKLIPAAKVREDLGPWKTASFDPPIALFDLAKDPSEQNDLAKQMPEKVQEMQSLLKTIRGN
jgi:arylsulfatase A